MKGVSLKNTGIDNGDLLIIDRSLEPTNGKIAVCYIDGEFTAKRIKISKREIWLIPENEDIHNKPSINFKLSFLFPGVGFEFGLIEKMSINSMLKNDFGYNSSGGWIIHPFIDTQLRYYLNIDKRKAKNIRTYKYSGNYICLMDGFYLETKSNLIGIEYGWQQMVNKHWHTNFGVGAGKWTNGNQRFLILYDFDFGYNF